MVRPRDAGTARKRSARKINSNSDEPRYDADGNRLSERRPTKTPPHIRGYDNIARADFHAAREALSAENLAARKELATAAVHPGPGPNATQRMAHH